jgi:hypothetical protein
MPVWTKPFGIFGLKGRFCQPRPKAWENICTMYLTL